MARTPSTKPKIGSTRKVNPPGERHSLREIARLLGPKFQSSTAVLRLFQSGQLTASIFWPDPTLAIDMPPHVWAGITPNGFHVRGKDRYNRPQPHFEMPTDLVIADVCSRLSEIAVACMAGDPTACDQSLLQGLAPDGIDPSAIPTLHERVVDLLGKAAVETRHKLPVYVTDQNWKRYSGPENRGRPALPGADEFWIEVIRRLKPPDHSLQKVLIFDMNSWAKKSHPNQGKDYAERRIKRLWQALGWQRGNDA